MSGFWLVRASAVKDQQALEQYGDLWGPIAERYGAEIIAGRSAIDTREGPHYPRQLIVQFPSFQDAVSCYEDPDYQLAMEYANRAFDRELSIVEG
jgi:uncharacterized protein (DUF1330 family)